MRETNYAINLPAEAFTACPSCRSSNYLRNLALDVYCHGCGWDSSSAFVEAGGMEALIYEYEMRLQSEAEQDSAARMRKREQLNRKHQMARRAV